MGVSLTVVLIALAVLGGWHAHIRVAIQVLPGLIPMQYNTALCFLALGAAGIGLSAGRRLLIVAGGSFAALMGAAVILEYASGTPSGIDTLFFYPWERTLSAHAGRMALTTAISFALTGGALVVLAVRQGAYATFGIVNSIPLSLALTSLIGYVFQITYLLPFGLGSQMALHTSVAFLAYGIAMLGHAWQHAERGPDGLPRWGAGMGVALLPVLFVAAGAFFPEQSWLAVACEATVTIVGVALITVALVKLTTAKVAYKGLLLIALPLVLLLTFVGLVVHVKRQSESAQRMALHSSEILAVSQSLLTHIAEAESAVRGFVITGDDTFVTSYERSLGAVAATTAQLRTLVSDNPGQEAHASRIEQLTDQRTRRFAEILRLIRSGNKTPAQEDIRGETGPELMKQVRAELELFSREEARLSGERRRVLEASWQRLSWLLVAGTAGAILLASMLTLSFSRGISRRLQQLRDNASSLAAGKAMAPRLAGSDEIADLDRVFHEMAESLDTVTRREKAVIEGTTDGIFVTDLDHRFLMMNQGGADLLGTTIGRIVGSSIHDVFTPESARRIIDGDNAILAGGRTATYELAATTKAGVERTYLATRGPYRDRDGRVVGIFGINRDITERNRIAAELEQTRDAAWESVRLKAEFLANMSHEIRTPMNGVMGMTGLLLETTLSTTQREYAETIQSSGDALLRIIDDILDFSKAEAGLLRFETIDFDVRGAVESTVDLLAEKAQAKGLEIASLVHRDVHTALRGDPGRLRQVLTNLAGNAVKFTERGEVVVSVKRISETDSHAALRFEVRDTGIGISEEGQRGLFRAFTQADGSTTRKYGGTGLGLAISKQLVELMAGRMGIESAPGHGSTFWFTVEFEKQRAPAVAATGPTGNLAGARVLIVDDNATNRRILTHETTSWDMIATDAESGEQALEMLRAGVRLDQPYDIAILDLLMPGMNGFQLADAVKADPAIAAVALVLLPSTAERGHGEQARLAGIAAYLQKPVQQSRLYKCLTEVMTQSQLRHGPVTAPRLVTRHSMREADMQQIAGNVSHVRILVAEDNFVNQQVALGQLANLGYGAETVTNGREALDALERRDFDIILMDCQMPHMDGFAATAEIRRREGTTRHTTIIAMTANALDGDRERCLASGMDDYISKPVKSDLLRMKLEQWTRPHQGTSNAPDEPAPSTRVGVIDQEQLASLRGSQQAGQPDCVTEVIDVFLSEAASQIEALQAALGRDDAAEIKLVARELRVGSATMGATRMAALSEELGGRGPIAHAADLVAALEAELALVREALSVERKEAEV